MLRDETGSRASNKDSRVSRDRGRRIRWAETRAANPGKQVNPVNLGKAANRASKVITRPAAVPVRQAHRMAVQTADRLADHAAARGPAATVPLIASGMEAIPEVIGRKDGKR